MSWWARFLSSAKNHADWVWHSSKIGELYLLSLLSKYCRHFGIVVGGSLVRENKKVPTQFDKFLMLLCCQSQCLLFLAPHDWKTIKISAAGAHFGEFYITFVSDDFMNLAFIRVLKGITHFKWTHIQKTCNLLQFCVIYA